MSICSGLYGNDLCLHPSKKFGNFVAQTRLQELLPDRPLILRRIDGGQIRRVDRR